MFHLKIKAVALRSFDEEILQSVLSVCRGERLIAHPWLYSVLAEAGLPVICVETRHMRAMLKAHINKTDRNDARGIAQTMRAGLVKA